jgi:hypothetical protein
MLIDWDSARYHCAGPEGVVAYTTHLTEFMKPYRDALIVHVSARFGIDEAAFAAKVRAYRKYTEVFDVNRAAMMMAKVNAGEVQGDVQHFRTTALERIRIYEESFGSEVKLDEAERVAK